MMELQGQEAGRKSKKNGQENAGGDGRTEELSSWGKINKGCEGHWLHETHRFPSKLSLYTHHFIFHW